VPHNILQGFGIHSRRSHTAAESMTRNMRRDIWKLNLINGVVFCYRTSLSLVLDSELIAKDLQYEIVVI